MAEMLSLASPWRLMGQYNLPVGYCFAQRYTVGGSVCPEIVLWLYVLRSCRPVANRFELLICYNDTV